MKQTILVLKVTFVSVLGGATFIRWGRRDCEDTATGTALIYSGKVFQITFYRAYKLNYLLFEFNLLSQLCR